MMAEKWEELNDIAKTPPHSTLGEKVQVARETGCGRAEKHKWTNDEIADLKAAYKQHKNDTIESIRTDPRYNLDHLSVPQVRRASCDITRAMVVLS